jgi:metal-responsive CopG/Arc/MetJ family transcriptional regulator
MKNVQISFDENLLTAIDRIAATSRESRSSIIRKALEFWIRQKEINEFEQEWIRKLKENPDESKTTDSWIESELWESK